MLKPNACQIPMNAIAPSAYFLSPNHTGKSSVQPDPYQLAAGSNPSHEPVSAACTQPMSQPLLRTSLTTPTTGCSANSHTIAIASSVAITGRKKTALYISPPNRREEISIAAPRPRATDTGTTTTT